MPKSPRAVCSLSDPERIKTQFREPGGGPRLERYQILNGHTQNNLNTKFWPELIKHIISGLGQTEILKELYSERNKTLNVKRDTLLNPLGGLLLLQL
jgi:hypothetical protein